MLFNSYEFLIFFPLVTALFFLLPHRIRWAHLLLASIVFYMAFLPVYVLILIITILVDYLAGIIIERSAGPRRKRYLIYSLVANIGFLCLFKYWDFFTGSLNEAFTLHLPLLRDMWLSHWIVTSNNVVNTGLNQHIGTHLPLIQNVILPIGLSFHTFQAMSYTIEVYRGNQKAERHLGIYALYVMFYPQLVAGPIERPQNVLHQFHEVKKFSWDNLQSGLRLMAWGLFKKVVIADRISNYVDIIYNEPAAFHYLNVIIATVLFAIQIYCDFSGYSDMAIGIARTMGYDLMINFNRPYFSKNIRQFWSRWHISLSSWFRDYLYIPLGGNRVSEGRLYVNTAIVFIISGFWHGANWTFIIWGALHGAYTIIHIFYQKRLASAGVVNPTQTTSPKRYFAGFFNFLLTFFFVCIAWVFFRAPSVHAAFEIIHRMFSSVAGTVFQVALTGKRFHGEFGGTSIVISILMILFMLVVEWKISPRLTELGRRPLLDMYSQPFKFLSIVGVSVLTVVAGSLFFKKGYNKFIQHKTHRLNELLTGHTPYNVIFLGSSRTHTTIDPGIIDSLLHIRSFNAGIEGGRMPEIDMMFSAYLQNHPPPQYLVLTIDADFIAHGKTSLFYPIQYFDYVQNKVVKKALEADGYHMALYRLLPFLQVTSCDDMTRSYALKGWSGKTDIDGTYDRAGYLSNGGEVVADSVVPKILIDTTGFSRAKSSFLNIISTCHRYQTQLIFTYAPQYNPGDTSGIEDQVTYRYADSLSGAENIPFLKHHLLPMCSDRKLFANVNHVNQAGARTYCPILADTLRQLMASKR